MYDFKATLSFTHGNLKVEGSMIFVLAIIAENEKRPGWISTGMSQDLIDELAAAKTRRGD